MQLWKFNIQRLWKVEGLLELFNVPSKFDKPFFIYYLPFQSICHFENSLSLKQIISARLTKPIFERTRFGKPSKTVNNCFVWFWAISSSSKQFETKSKFDVKLINVYFSYHEINLTWGSSVRPQLTLLMYDGLSKNVSRN